VSPYLELCCLRLSASLSYEKAAEELEVQTGRRVSQKTQQRLVHRQSFEEASNDGPVTRMSLDGGMIRLRTPKGEELEWKEFKAINLMDSHQGIAWFKDNASLLAWANELLLGERVYCLGDGHDGVWSLYASIGDTQQRHEILDWYHLVENLHKIPGSNQRLKDAEALLWTGDVDGAIRLFEDCNSDDARKFRGYLERHRTRIPNYGYYQAENIPIGSGDVESLIKQLSSRTKISGAAWDARHVPQVLAHRCAYLNGSLSPHHKFSL
jgi:hypothetical protein